MTKTVLASESDPVPSPRLNWFLLHPMPAIDERSHQNFHRRLKQFLRGTNLSPVVSRTRIGIITHGEPIHPDDLLLVADWLSRQPEIRLAPIVTLGTLEAFRS